MFAIDSGGITTGKLKCWSYCVMHTSFQVPRRAVRAIVAVEFGPPANRFRPSHPDTIAAQRRVISRTRIGAELKRTRIASESSPALA